MGLERLHPFSPVNEKNLFWIILFILNWKSVYKLGATQEKNIIKICGQPHDNSVSRLKI